MTPPSLGTFDLWYPQSRYSPKYNTHSNYIWASRFCVFMVQKLVQKMDPNITPKMLVLDPKMVPKMGWKLPGDIGPSHLGHPSGARWPQDGPKMAQDAQDAPKMAQDSPKMGQDAPKMPQDGPKMAQKCPEMAPRWPQDGPKCLSRGFPGDLPSF